MKDLEITGNVFTPSFVLKDVAAKVIEVTMADAQVPGHADAPASENASGLGRKSGAATNELIARKTLGYANQYLQGCTHKGRTGNQVACDSCAKAYLDAVTDLLDLEDTEHGATGLAPLYPLAETSRLVAKATLPLSRMRYREVRDDNEDDLDLVRTIKVSKTMIECPHCGCEQPVWLSDPRGLEDSCDHCSKPFRVSHNVTVQIE